MKNDKDKEPKLHIDDDWKAQAQAEKEKLSKEEQPAAEAKPDARQVPLPPPSFTLLVLSLVTQARICLADLDNPITKKKQLDLEAAKHHIDMLEMIDAKTSGNLSDQEKKLLDSVLYELRLRYVQLS
ncbi:MAG: DUF1844 domain-containing protein [Phycisphaerae bacterium]|nr:DUF1844 domain-containing protein [Phycisphaerae bacterium]